MKKFKNYFLLGLLTICMGFAFTACGDDDDDDFATSDLVGKWNIIGYEAWETEDGEKWETNSVKDSDITALKFNADNTCKVYFDYFSEEGTYRVSGNKLIIVLDNDDDNAGAITIAGLNSTTLVLENSYSEVEDGTTYEGYEKYTFTRVD